MRFIAIVVLSVIAIYLVVSPAFMKPAGATITFVDPESTCSPSVGTLVNQIEGNIITSVKDFDRALSDKKAGQVLTMVIDSKPTRCTVLRDGYIGIFVGSREVKALKFGIDIEGGARVLLQAKDKTTPEQIEKSIGILNNRINFYGLSDVKISPIGENIIQIEMGGATGEEVQAFIAKQGKFEGKLQETIGLRNGTGNLIFDGNIFPLEKTDGEISFNNASYSVGESFVIDGIKFEYVNATNESVVLHANIFTGEDIVAVFTDPQSSIIRPADGGYEFVFSVQISQGGAQKFAKATKGQPTVIRGGGNYIAPQLVLFLDSQKVSELNVAAGLAGQAVTTVSINGFRDTRDEAATERLRLETILRSGSLPLEFEVVKVDTVTQTAGKQLINSIIFVTIAIAIAVSAIIFFRYRDLKIAGPMIALSLGEVLLLLGVAASQVFAALVIIFALAIAILKKEVLGMIGWMTVLVMIIVAVTVTVAQWTLDIAAIAGLIAILGTSVGQMIIMTDQLLKNVDVPVRERYRSALSLIWNSAATVVFAMIPLLLIGVGALKGFAIATIIGVLIGLLITRPAYMAILQKIKKLNLEEIQKQ